MRQDQGSNEGALSQPGEAGGCKEGFMEEVTFEVGKSMCLAPAPASIFVL